MKVKEESEKDGFKTQHSKNWIMAFSPITSWQIDGGQAETVIDFIFLCSQITVTIATKLKDACSLEEKLW